jgi:hypothetical protein
MQPPLEFVQISGGVTVACGVLIVIVVVISTVTIWTLVGIALAGTAGGAAEGVVNADVATADVATADVERVVGKFGMMLEEIGAGAADEGKAAVEDDAGIGAEPMKPSPIWNTLIELTCQYASAKSAGLFWT